MILRLISRETGVSLIELEMICATASQRYRKYSIPKRTGGRRTINHPAPELKYLQRWLSKNVFSRLPIHECAYAYRKRRSIADGARLHVHNNYLLKVDFSNFFPSLSGTDVQRVLMQNMAQLDHVTFEDMDVIRAVVCKDDKLTIGAPSSPVLSNAILYEFDKWIAMRAAKSAVAYSRYADDLFLSTNRSGILTQFLGDIRSDLVKRSSPMLTINDAKTVFTSAKHRRVVTGIVLSSDGEISVGRQKKRQLKTLIYLYSQGNLKADMVSYLRGYMAFITGVEEKFILSMEKKYGKGIIDRLMEEELTQRKT